MLCAYQQSGPSESRVKVRCHKERDSAVEIRGALWDRGQVALTCAQRCFDHRGFCANRAYSKPAAVTINPKALKNSSADKAAVIFGAYWHDSKCCRSRSRCSERPSLFRRIATLIGLPIFMCFAKPSVFWSPNIVMPTSLRIGQRCPPAVWNDPYFIR